ncbi:putative serine protease K12H4.7 [Pseudolycoriella hygida]|uniref:Serine protease K12H4.7 n=1 Tax=Pseudolycoriella hygida TaxID=35572 RepID=A0A9Q0NA33_9DIPT|nr:putative serine protease K12H4.7 [Pseudolycoriella hygida]
MNSLILIAIATSAIFAVSGYEFQSPKMEPYTSPYEYKKLTSDRWDEREPVEGMNQFYEGIFRARLDHFRPQNQDRVDFTYHVNANHYNPEGGPIYIHLKDFRDYSTRWIERGLMVDIAAETGAAVLTLDYRYFGINRPTPTASFEDLEFLSVEQILADVAEFARFVRQYIGGGRFTPVILWGSGFGGVLSFWARSRYPHVIDATWTSSGYIQPELASYGPYDIFEYTFFIPDDGRCISLIRNAYDIIAYLVINHQGEYLSGRMNLCHPVQTDSEADVAALYEITIRAILSFINEFHYTGVRSFCTDLGAIPGDTLNSFARWLRYVYGDAECFDHSYDTQIVHNVNTTWGSPGTIAGTRQWYYLQCTQIGSFLLADTNTWLPGIVTLDYHLEKCADVFGAEIDYETLRSAFNTLVQEYDQTVSNVVYTNGYFDPLRYFGRLYDPSGSGAVVNMDFAAKSADLLSQTVNDPQSIYDGKTAIREHILRWSNMTGPSIF